MKNIIDYFGVKLFEFTQNISFVIIITSPKTLWTDMCKKTEKNKFKTFRVKHVLQEILSLSVDV